MFRVHSFTMNIRYYSKKQSNSSYPLPVTMATNFHNDEQMVSQKFQIAIKTPFQVRLTSKL